jgi:DNA invertase Pin-like site-specific DNA recombinase
MRIETAPRPATTNAAALSNRHVALMAAELGDRETARRLGLPEHVVCRARRIYTGKARRRRTTDKRIPEVRTLLEMGLSAAQIAKRLGVSTRAIHATIDWAGYEYRWAKIADGRAPRDDLDLRILAMADQGLSSAAMSRDTGLSPGQVGRRLTGMGYRARWVRMAQGDDETARRT